MIKIIEAIGQSISFYFQSSGCLVDNLIQWINDKYNYPTILVSENGLGIDDPTLDDENRINYLKVKYF